MWEVGFLIIGGWIAVAIYECILYKRRSSSWLCWRCGGTGVMRVRNWRFRCRRCGGTGSPIKKQTKE